MDSVAPNLKTDKIIDKTTETEKYRSTNLITELITEPLTDPETRADTHINSTTTRNQHGNKGNITVDEVHTNKNTNMGTNKSTNKINMSTNKSTTPKKGTTRRGKKPGKSTKINKLKILTINVRGIKGKLTSLTSALNTHGTHIAAITETLLGNNEKITIPGYTWKGKNREKKKGGGVGFLIRDDIKNLTTDIQIETSHTEIKWIRLKCKENIAIGVFYGKQENINQDDADDQFNELTTQTNLMINEGQVILMGDMNAKIESEDNSNKQEPSRNGKLLIQYTEATNTLIINKSKTHSGIWTRTNKQGTKKSLIDYIIMSEQIANQTKESETDEQKSLAIRGKNPTDHNTITATVNINARRENTKNWQWKKGNLEKWTKYNHQIEKTWRENDQSEKDSNCLHKIIVESLTDNIGRKWNNPNRKTSITNDKIKTAKSKRKQAKKRFEAACRNENPEGKNLTKTEYIASQKEVRHQIEKQIKKNIKTVADKITKEGGVNSNLFWKIRKRIQKTEDQYETIDEEGTTIKNPNKAKQHIADFFEDLYQAREGAESHQKWTDLINRTVTEALKTDQPKPTIDQIRYDEVVKAIGTIKRNKSLGPDKIPNEAFIEANQKTRKIITEALNRTYQEEIIPKNWKEGEIIRLYKGKGVKGKCSNERGITLASNTGKLFERIINNRIKEIINITEAQAGGIQHRSTCDHTILLNSIISYSRKELKKPIHIAFMDVTKAYDKAWLNAIIYTAQKSGIQGKHLRIMNELNNGITAEIRTKHGNTRKIEIKDSIRQGGVLSVIEYANLIDEISKEINNRNQGKIRTWGTETTGCLLWMDDVALIHHDKKELKKMLETTNEIANRYHIKFGKEKSQILTIGPKKGNTKFNLGEMDLSDTKTYKYLGITMNTKGDLTDHIVKLKGKVEATFQNILSLAGNQDFNNMRMAVIWKLVKSCILPTITYGAEAWVIKEKELKTLQKIMDNILKRILKTPRTTPSEVVAAETGIWAIKLQIWKKQITYLNKIVNQKNDSILHNIMTDEHNPWAKQMENILKESGITIDQIKTATPEQIKKLTTKKLQQYHIKTIEKVAETKSKVRHYVALRNQDDRRCTPEYINKLSRSKCADIFRVRSRMLKVKANYKSIQNNTTCRWCNSPQETQEHILSECIAFKDITKDTKYNTIFKDNNRPLEKLAIVIANVKERLATKQLTD